MWDQENDLLYQNHDGVMVTGFYSSVLISCVRPKVLVKLSPSSFESHKMAAPPPLNKA